jgi:hypothetical protein
VAKLFSTTTLHIVLILALGALSSLMTVLLLAEVLDMYLAVPVGLAFQLTLYLYTYDNSDAMRQWLKLTVWGLSIAASVICMEGRLIHDLHTAQNAQSEALNVERNAKLTQSLRVKTAQRTVDSLDAEIAVFEANETLRTKLIQADLDNNYRSKARGQLDATDARRSALASQLREAINRLADAQTTAVATTLAQQPVASLLTQMGEAATRVVLVSVALLIDGIVFSSIGSVRSAPAQQPSEPPVSQMPEHVVKAVQLHEARQAATPVKREAPREAPKDVSKQIEGYSELVNHFKAGKYGSAPSARAVARVTGLPQRKVNTLFLRLEADKVIHKNANNKWEVTA